MILWADTFTNHFQTPVAVAAAEVLEDAGYHVAVPHGHVCCGRPLYDYGMLDLAQRYLDRILRRFRDEIRAGTPVVGVEPSCVAVLKDELVKMYPNDEDAKRLARQTLHFAEFLEREGYEPPQLHRRVLLHEHCHQHATGGAEADKKLLEQMGCEVEKPDSGCCGMAGAWGYERGHYDVSTKCGERVLLPKVREAPRETVIVSAGFSCREQVEQGKTGRKALHLAQVIRLAQEYGPDGPPGAAEDAAASPPAPPAARRAARVAAAVSLAAAAGGAAWATLRR